MIYELALEGFRGIKKGRLELFPMTVLLGANNSGKTTVLEALYLLYPPSPLCLSSYAAEPPGALSIVEVIHTYHKTLDSRGYRFLLHDYDGEAVIACRLSETLRGLVLRAEESWVKTHSPVERSVGGYPNLEAFMSELRSMNLGGIYLRDSGTIGMRDRRPPKCLFVKLHLADLAMCYVKRKWGLIRGRGLTGKIARKISKLVNEDYDDLTLEPHIGGGLSLNLILRETKVGIRLSDMGDGMRMLALAMLLWELSKADLLLWDDVEAFMSPSSLIYLSQWMSSLVERGAQVIVATHSREAAKLLAGAAEEAGHEARVVLLALRDGVLKHRVLTVEEVEELEEAGVDVRMAEGFLL